MCVEFEEFFLQASFAFWYLNSVYFMLERFSRKDSCLWRLLCPRVILFTSGGECVARRLLVEKSMKTDRFVVLLSLLIVQLWPYCVYAQVSCVRDLVLRFSYHCVTILYSVRLPRVVVHNLVFFISNLRFFLNFILFLNAYMKFF